MNFMTTEEKYAEFSKLKQLLIGKLVVRMNSPRFDLTRDLCIHSLNENFLQLDTCINSSRIIVIIDFLDNFIHMMGFPLVYSWINDLLRGDCFIWFNGIPRK